MENRKILFFAPLVLVAAALFSACPSPVGAPPPAGQMETVATPSISLPSGELESVPATASFTSATAGVAFRYTIDGTEPSDSSPSATSVEVAGPLTLKVIATKEGMNPSAVAEAAYTVRAAETDSSLSSLGYSIGVLTPAFSAAVLDYRLTVPDSAPDVTIAASSLSSRASVAIDGGTPAAASASAVVAVAEGDSVVVRVVAEDGVSETSYTLRVAAAHHGSFGEGSAGSAAMDDAQWKIAMSSDGGAYFAYPELGMELFTYLYKSTDGGATWSELASAGDRDWYSIAASANGSVVAAAYYESSNYYLVVSQDGGTGWSAPRLLNTSSPPSIAMSADGRYQYLTAHLDSAEGSYAAYDDCLFRSADFGATWVAAIDFSQEEDGTSADSGKLDWTRLACSADGNTVVAGGANTWDRGGVMRSTDRGITWSETYLGAGKPIRELALSADGRFLACVQIFDVCVSSDLGATWTTAARPSAGGVGYTPSKLHYSSDGSLLVGLHDRMYSNVAASHLFASTNNGTSWTSRCEWPDYTISSSSALSGGGQKMLLAKDHSILESLDGGSSWSTLEGSGRRSWSFIALSRDGRCQLASTSLAATNSTFLTAGWLYSSGDSGGGWTRLDSLGKRSWSFLAVSDSGEELVAAYYESSKHYVLTSANGGASWSSPVELSGYSDPRGASISADGEVIVLVSASGSRCYLSTNGGLSWAPISVCATASGVKGGSVSRDGATLVIVGSSTIWNSADGGLTWGSTSYSAAGDKVDLSDDGKCIALSDRNGYVRLSKDGGASWSSIALPGSNASAESANRCVGVAVSSDGRGLVAATALSTAYGSSGYYAAAPGSILLSMDGGSTWTRAASAGGRAWTNVAASEDLRVIAAAARETEDGVLGCR